MTGKGHRRVNIVTSPAVWVALLNVTTPLAASVATLAYIAACRLPDHLEWRISFTETLIPHRTITHWGVFWFALATVGYGWLVDVSWMPALHSPEPWQTLAGAALFGCAAGSIMHLLMDAPDYMGIPWLVFWKRHRLCWWQSGRFETPIVIFMGILTLIFIAAEGHSSALPVMDKLYQALT